MGIRSSKPRENCEGKPWAAHEVFDVGLANCLQNRVKSEVSGDVR